jgi:hypothetical protein
VANAGPISATFASGNTILLDNLPGTNISYGAPSIANGKGITGTLIPGVDGSGNLAPVPIARRP